MTQECKYKASLKGFYPKKKSLQGLKYLCFLIINFVLRVEFLFFFFCFAQNFFQVHPHVYLFTKQNSIYFTILTVAL